MAEIDRHLVQHPQSDAGRHQTFRQHLQRRRDRLPRVVRLKNVAKHRENVVVDGDVRRRRRQNPLAREAAQSSDGFEEIAAGRNSDLEVTRVRGFVPAMEKMLSSQFSTTTF